MNTVSVAKVAIVDSLSIVAPSVNIFSQVAAWDWGLIISITTLLLGIIMFYRYDKRLKTQEEKLNAYQIRKNEKEEEDSKKASIEANITKGVKSTQRTLKIFNKGEAQARNINMEIIGDYPNTMWSLKGLFPHSKLNKHQGIDVSFTCIKCIGQAPQKLKVKFTWDDDYQSGNEDIQEYPF
ncbi:MAG: hypothetical protein SNJ29_10000 [Rikenellaceae bacterium]